MVGWCDLRAKGHKELRAVRTIILGLGGVARTYQVEWVLHIAEGFELAPRRMDWKELPVALLAHAGIHLIGDDFIYAEPASDDDFKNEVLLGLVRRIAPAHCDDATLLTLYNTRLSDGSWKAVLENRVLGPEASRIVQALREMEASVSDPSTVDTTAAMGT